jgi:hypothetical protein
MTKGKSIFLALKIKWVDDLKADGTGDTKEEK